MYVAHDLEGISKARTHRGARKLVLDGVGHEIAPAQAQ